VHVIKAIILKELIGNANVINYLAHDGAAEHEFYLYMEYVKGTRLQDYIGFLKI
jgi:hypothetical protein